MTALQLSIFSLSADLSRIASACDRNSDDVKKIFCREAKRWINEMEDAVIPKAVRVQIEQSTRMVSSPDDYVLGKDFEDISKDLLEYGLSIGEL